MRLLLLKKLKTILVPEFTVRMLNGNSYTNSEFGAGGTASKANSQYGLNAVYGDRMTFAYRSGDWRFVHTINHLADIDPDYNYGETYECPECNTAYGLYSWNHDKME